MLFNYDKIVVGLSIEHITKLGSYTTRKITFTYQTCSNEISLDICRNKNHCRKLQLRLNSIQTIIYNFRFT